VLFGSNCPGCLLQAADIADRAGVVTGNRRLNAGLMAMTLLASEATIRKEAQEC
jgi:hypothetical protein